MHSVAKRKKQTKKDLKSWQGRETQKEKMEGQGRKSKEKNNNFKSAKEDTKGDQILVGRGGHTCDHPANSRCDQCPLNYVPGSSMGTASPNFETAQIIISVEHLRTCRLREAEKLAWVTQEVYVAGREINTRRRSPPLHPPSSHPTIHEHPLPQGWEHHNLHSLTRLLERLDF